MVKVERLLRISRYPVSLERPVSEDGDTELGDFIEDSDALEPMDAAAREMLRESVKNALAVLSDRERQVLELRYEDMVADQLTQTRRLLDFCGLPWEESCLRFHETERAVRTASSEQVRQPIYSSSINHWRHFQRQLQPLMDVLGSELDEWDH